MNSFLALVLMVFITFSIPACTKTDRSCTPPGSLPDKINAITFEPSLKGWELYSWPANGENCEWKYSLFPGTNTLKTYTEVTSNRALSVTGEQQLKLLLNKLPANEDILWVGKTWLTNVWGAGNSSHGSLKLPAAAVIDLIKQHCAQRGLNLAVAQ